MPETEDYIQLSYIIHYIKMPQIPCWYSFQQQTAKQKEHLEAGYHSETLHQMKLIPTP